MVSFKHKFSDESEPLESSTTTILHQSNQHIFQHQSSVTSSSSIQTVLHHGTSNMTNSNHSQINGSGSLSSSLNNVIQPQQQYHQMNNNSSNVSSAEEVVLNVGDVADLLHPQFAIITGGRSMEGCPIITFPDHNNFLTLGDLEYQRLVFYLTSVPS